MTENLNINIRDIYKNETQNEYFKYISYNE